MAAGERVAGIPESEPASGWEWTYTRRAHRRGPRSHRGRASPHQLPHPKARTYVRATPDQSVAWLRARMQVLGIGSLEELAEQCDSDKGNLSRIFRQQQRPRVDALEPLAIGLDVSVYELLVRIGAVDPDDDEPPVVRKRGEKVQFTWPAA
jgi:transcriptional regulator with XRE-family HTH domain